MIRLTEQEFQDIVQYFHMNYGINLQHKKTLIECRMVKELERCNVSGFTEYLRLLKKDKTGETAGGMVNRLTTNYTYFMREPEHFRILEEKVLPELFTRRNLSSCSIWCAGCATGEEAYTLAMCMDDYQNLKNVRYGYRILGTDISEEVLKKARAGIYPKREREDIPETWRGRYCRKTDQSSFEIVERLKMNVYFQKHNLMQPLGSVRKFDIIFCRNVMIYFDKESRRRLISSLEDALNPGGYLFIGHAELLSRNETGLRQCHPAVYKKERT